MLNLRTQWTYLSVMAFAIALLSMTRILSVTRDLFHPGMDPYRGLWVLISVVIFTSIIHMLIFRNLVERFLKAITSAKLRSLVTSRMFYGTVILSYATAVVSTTVGLYEIASMFLAKIDAGISFIGVVCPIAGVVLLCLYEYSIRRLLKEHPNGSQ